MMWEEILGEGSKGDCKKLKEGITKKNKRRRIE